MTKERALKFSLEITNTLLSSTDLKSCPNEEMANNIADFISTLASRLERMITPE